MIYHCNLLMKISWRTYLLDIYHHVKALHWFNDSEYSKLWWIYWSPRRWCGTSLTFVGANDTPWGKYAPSLDDIFRIASLLYTTCTLYMFIGLFYSDIPACEHLMAELNSQIFEVCGEFKEFRKGGAGHHWHLLGQWYPTVVRETCTLAWWCQPTLKIFIM